MRQFLALSIGLALLIIISSCEKDPVAKHLSPWGDLTVSTQVNGEGISDVQIRIVGPDTMTAMTDSAGTVLFSPVEAGDYQVLITSVPPGVEFPPDPQSVSVPHGAGATTTFQGEWTVGSVVGVVRVDGIAQDRYPLDLHGPVSRYLTTNASGHFAFEDLPLGDYTLSHRRVPGRWEFPDTTVAVSVTPGGISTVNFLGTQRDLGVILVTVFLDDDRDLVWDPGEIRPPDVGLDYRGRGSSAGSYGFYGGAREYALELDAGTYTVWLADDPEGYAVDPAFEANVGVVIDWGETVRLDLPITPGHSYHVIDFAGRTLEVSPGLSLAIPPHALSADTLVTVLPSSVDVDLVTIPVLEIHPRGLELQAEASLHFTAPAGVQYPTGSTVWYVDEGSGAFAVAPTTVVVGGSAAATPITRFRDYLVPFMADPGFWVDMGDWFLGPRP